jgi:two-component system, OmpR family, phosphate regulon response regulator PhoB
MKKILVLDDDADILILMQLTLTMHHFAVEAISRWEEINDSIKKFNPDLILLDVSLNGADGRDICKSLKQSKNTNHIPIILFSANVEMGNNYEEFEAQAFIAKPYELSHLLQTIRLHLN